MHCSVEAAALSSNLSGIFSFDMKKQKHPLQTEDITDEPTTEVKLTGIWKHTGSDSLYNYFSAFSINGIADGTYRRNPHLSCCIE